MSSWRAIPRSIQTVVRVSVSRLAATRKPTIPFVRISFFGRPWSEARLIGYAYGVHSFYGISKYTGIAIHTALAIFLVAVGLLTARPSSGLMAIVCADDAGGLQTQVRYRLHNRTAQARAMTLWLRDLMDRYDQLSLRERVFPTPHYRLVFGDSDGLRSALPQFSALMRSQRAIKEYLGLAHQRVFAPQQLHGLDEAGHADHRDALAQVGPRAKS